MQYDKQFHKLSCFAKSLVATEKERMKRFVHGLKLIIHKDLALLDLKNHVEALDKALRLERLQDKMEKGNQEQKKRSYDQENDSEKNDHPKIRKQDQNS